MSDLENTILITEFDREVDSRCELIRANAENISANLLSALELTLHAIPDVVRKMPVKTLMEMFDGDIQKAADYYASQQTAPKKRAATPTSKSIPKSPTTFAKREPPVTASISRSKAATKPNPTISKSPLPKSPVKKRVTPLSGIKSPRKP